MRPELTTAKTGAFVLGEHDKTVIESLLAKVGNARQHNERLTVISYDELAGMLSAEEMKLMDRVYAIDPAMYGFKGPKLTIEPVPDALVCVEPQPYTYQGEQHLTSIQFVPEATFKVYGLMAEAMERQIGRKLLIQSSYRSPAFQAITFLSILKITAFDVAKTAQRAAVPGYSEHCTPSQLAFDFQNVDGLPSDETPQDFEGTQEYEWLIVNANRFNFYMSYPKGNAEGLMFEPWHWRHKPG